ncbi:MAG: lipoate--protein ligase family protein [Pseudomonadota bacterium]
MLGAVAVSGQPSTFLWQAEARALVLPERFTREPGFEAAAKASAARGWPVHARKTGGGITPQGPGVLNLALSFTVAPGHSRAILASYARIVDPLRAGFDRLGVATQTTAVEGSFCDGDYNLAVGGQKLVGTAQRWRGAACLIHALVLTDIDLFPAVAAVAQFSADLGHDTRFCADKHCRLADHLPVGTDSHQAATDALWQVVSDAGYVPFAP